MKQPIEFKISKSSPVFAKIGIYGEAGSGKTMTASLFAIGLHKLIESKKPVCFLDSEAGSDFVRILFDQAKIEMAVIKDRAFATLEVAISAAKQIGDILIIDSISHFYDDMNRTYMEEKHKTDLTFPDYNVLKPRFYKFTSEFVAAPLHIIIAGRTANVWDFSRNEKTGKLEVSKEGTRMRTEKEMGFEPHLLIEMEKVYKTEGAGFIHQARIFKDRNPDKTTTLEGKIFNDPTFADILPHIESLNVKGVYGAVDIEGSKKLFIQNGISNISDETKKKIILEEMENLLTESFPTTKPEDKMNRLTAVRNAFGITAKTAIENLSIDQLKEGYNKLRVAIKGESPIAAGGIDKGFF